MVRVTCDLCGKELRSGHDASYVVKIEVFPLRDPVEITEADLEEDHLEAVSQLLREMDEEAPLASLEPCERKFRFDLCSPCRAKFVQDPLGRDSARNFDFSEN